MTGSVLVVGDANVDLIVQGDIVPRFRQAEQLLDSASLVLGSSAGIMAAGVAKLEVPTTLLAVIGDDEFGRFTRSELAAAGVITDELLTDAEVPTGISVILSAPHDRSILTLPGTIPLLTADAVRAAVESVRPDHVHFASYFLQPVLAAELPSLLAWLRGRGIRTSLDTNWDPAGRWDGLAAVLPQVDYLMPNREELQAIAVALGCAAGADDETAASFLAELGPRVVVKAGADGGWSLDSDNRNGNDTSLTRAAGLALDVVDTTGAGDSFDAGYVAAIAHGIDDEAQRLRWATVAGSLSTRANGGTAAQPTLTELREF
ncbi:MAG: carbohydrate kinase family protein, partial [Microbacteriaceae bacterium]